MDLAKAFSVSAKPSLVSRTSVGVKLCSASLTVAMDTPNGLAIVAADEVAKGTTLAEDDGDDWGGPYTYHEHAFLAIKDVEASRVFVKSWTKGRCYANQEYKSQEGNY